MKFLFFLYFACVVSLALTDDIKPAHDDPPMTVVEAPKVDELLVCDNGRNFNTFCCLDHKEAWFTDLVPLDDIAFIQIEPYTCADPSYCVWHVTRNGDLLGGPDFLWIDPMDDNSKKEAAKEEWKKRHYSGAGLSCGPITFILCENTGKQTWACYAKVEDPTITVTFTQPLQCVYVEQNGTTYLQVGSCVANQQTVESLSPSERVYEELSTNVALPFMPILNPSAVSALRRQSGINKIVRRSEAPVMAAYLPIPEKIIEPEPVEEEDKNIFFSFDLFFFHILCITTSVGSICFISIMGYYQKRDFRIRDLQKRVSELEINSDDFIEEQEEPTFVPIHEKI